MPANGRFPPSALTQVQTGIYLSTPTAHAWQKAVAAAPGAIGRSISIAKPAGGYRTYAVQADMRVHPELYNLNPGSSVSLALPGYSKHGLGVCVDVVGSRIDSVLINFLRRYGFTRPLPGDPNHFIHDGVTAIGYTPPKIVKPYNPPSSPVKGAGTPTQRKTVAVQAGESLARIAAKNGITYARILILNPSIRDPNRIYPGLVVRIR